MYIVTVNYDWEGFSIDSSWLDLETAIDKAKAAKASKYGDWVGVTHLIDNQDYHFPSDGPKVVWKSTWRKQKRDAVLTRQQS